MDDLEEAIDSETSARKDTHYLLRSWQGSEPLWKAYWINYVLMGACFSRLGDSLAGSQNLVLLCGYLLLICTFLIWALTSVWRCAFNTSHKFWGYLARFVAIIATVAGLIFG